jgi:hypothetical protein
MKPQAKDSSLRPNAEAQLQGETGADDSHSPAPALDGQSPNARAAEVTAAIQQLWMKLQMASAYNPAEPDHGRSSARIALIGMLEFLSVLFPDTPTLPIALQDLLQGLVDLDRGTVIPLLTPAETRGRRPNPLSDDLSRALVAAAMTSLMTDRKMSRELASRNIARRLSEMGYRSRKIGHVQIAKWREKMMTERAAENLAVQRYEFALTWVEGKEPREAVKFLLDNLQALCPTDFPKKGTF